jgi:hypothetical protein
MCLRPALLSSGASLSCQCEVQLPRRNDGVEYWAFRVGRVPKRPTGFCGSRVPKRPTGYVARRHANPPTPLTRHRPCRGDKLSRLAPPSELIKRHPPCGIRDLAEDENMAPILPGEFALILPTPLLM